MRIFHQSLLHIVSRRQNDTLTLQVDKCVLTTLGEISTWSAGSLPGTRFYLHLLRLAEETVNLLRDLWLQFWNSPPCSLLFGSHPDFSPFVLWCYVPTGWSEPLAPLLAPHLPRIRTPVHVSLWQTCARVREQACARDGHLRDFCFGYSQKIRKKENVRLWFDSDKANRSLFIIKLN